MVSRKRKQIIFGFQGIGIIMFISLKSYWFALSGLAVAASIAVLVIFGLKPGIDFTGGTLLQIAFMEERPSNAEVQNALSPLELGNIIVQPTGEKDITIRTRFLTEEEHQRALLNLRAIGTTSTLAITEPSVLTVLEQRFETIGPSVSSALRRRAFGALAAVIIAVIVYIAYSFRKVSKPVQSWKYGVTVVVALAHDVLIATAAFALLGRFRGVEVDISFAVALLTIMSYSMNNSIIVFDRVRENLVRRGSSNFRETVNAGIQESVVRTVNSSFMTLLVLFAMYFFGGDTIHYFSLALIIGIFVGTYSALFLSSPLLVVWEEWRKRV